MLKEAFLGHNPSHFTINPLVKAYIIAEAFLWSAWNFILPIFAVFVVNNIAGGTLQTAAASYSVHLVVRVIFELISGKQLIGSTDRKKLIITVIGMCTMSFAYFGFMFANTSFDVFIFFALAGAGMGFATPAKNSLFSIHLDKNKESTEWSLADAICLFCMALSTALGGFIATEYGFDVLFFIAAVVNLLGIIPYLLYMPPRAKSQL